MKLKCYPRYSYALYYCLSIVCVLLSVLPLFINRNEDIIYKLLWSGIMALFAIVFFLVGLSFCQTCLVKGNLIILKNSFGKMVEIDLKEAVYDVVELDTYFSWVVSMPKKWICIYNKNGDCERFKKGFSNKKNIQRIQIIYSKQALSELKRRNISSVISS